jgi:hypothetical protein
VDADQTRASVPEVVVAEAAVAAAAAACRLPAPTPAAVNMAGRNSRSTHSSRRGPRPERRAAAELLLMSGLAVCLGDVEDTEFHINLVGHLGLGVCVLFVVVIVVCMFFCFFFIQKKFTVSRHHHHHHRHQKNFFFFALLLLRHTLLLLAYTCCRRIYAFIYLHKQACT